MYIHKDQIDYAQYIHSGKTSYAYRGIVFKDYGKALTPGGVLQNAGQDIWNIYKTPIGCAIIDSTVAVGLGLIYPPLGLAYSYISIISPWTPKRAE